VVLGFAGCPQRMGAAHRDSALALG
jgi:hypothetical protein